MSSKSEILRVVWCGPEEIRKRLGGLNDENGLVHSQGRASYVEEKACERLRVSKELADSATEGGQRAGVWTPLGLGFRASGEELVWHLGSRGRCGILVSEQ